MIKEIVDFRLTYSQAFIPRRYRNPRYKSLSARCPLVILRISEEEAPISHLVVGNDGSETIVRRFDGRYWWPLLASRSDGDGPFPASVAAFTARAAQDSPFVADVLGCWHIKEAEDENVLFGSKSRLLDAHPDSQWESRRGQWKQAERGANRTLFCGSAVLVEGGPPVYFGTSSYSRPRDLSIRVGPSNADCQSAPKFDPGSASNFDPFERRVLTVALASSELAGVAETWRARAA